MSLHCQLAHSKEKDELSCLKQQLFCIFSGTPFHSLEFSSSSFCSVASTDALCECTILHNFSFFEAHTLWRSVDCHCHLWEVLCLVLSTFPPLLPVTFAESPLSLSCSAVPTKACYSWLQYLYSARQRLYVQTLGIMFAFFVPEILHCRLSS